MTITKTLAVTALAAVLSAGAAMPANAGGGHGGGNGGGNGNGNGNGNNRPSNSVEIDSTFEFEQSNEQEQNATLFQGNLVYDSYVKDSEVKQSNAGFIYQNQDADNDAEVEWKWIF